MKHGISYIAGRFLLVVIIAAFLALGSRSATAATEAGSIDTYRKAWSDVSKRIDKNIERNRKGNATIEIIGEDSQPLKDATLNIQQKTHAFLFGCNAFVLGQLPSDEMNKRYEDSFIKLFNFATVPFYWAGTEPNKGELRYEEPATNIWRRPPPDRFIPWAAKNGVTLKGHPLLWHAHNPSWLPKDADELRELYRKRFKEITSRFAGKIFIWDVVNESLVCPKSYQLYTPDRAYVEWVFKEVAPLFPEKTTLMINEVTEYNFIPVEKNPYFSQVKTLLANGAKVRGIGFQYHFFRRKALDGYMTSSKSDPAKLLDVYEKFNEFNLPLYVTEITFPSAGDDGEALQAEVVRDHYRLWFCTPRMAGITWWNLGDGTAVKGENEAKGGLTDEELKPKSAYRALDKLINEEWKTKTQVKTDDKGTAKFRGFYGKYTIKVTAGNKSKEFEIDLSKDCQTPHKLSLK
ncbi:MAG: endo-1,4-beta-xylanase [Kiritimatiellae bacterium]|nr:endo-1,4-beta-xylanase [Kiritimatiellia bacterium]MDD5519185.1 endo-1,4-beta-xylanase [Kiritimatiellia bacterium]